jgi:hypothetical protein
VKYYVADEKVTMTQKLLELILVLAWRREAIGARLLATALGKVISMSRLHGTVLNVLSKDAQHELGTAVMARGWATQLHLSNHNAHKL